MTTQQDKFVQTDEQWRARLTAEQYRVTRGKGTEQPFCGLLLHEKKPGTYSCVCCGTPIFSSDSKFDSGTGWPSFFQPIEGSVLEKLDESHGMQRTEILCNRCDAHLGHVFPDGPPPTGKRYCLNSVSLLFTPQQSSPVASSPSHA